MSSRRVPPPIHRVSSIGTSVEARSGSVLPRDVAPTRSHLGAPGVPRPTPAPRRLASLRPAPWCGRRRHRARGTRRHHRRRRAGPGGLPAAPLAERPAAVAGGSPHRRPVLLRPHARADPPGARRRRGVQVVRPAADAEPDPRLRRRRHAGVVARSPVRRRDALAAREGRRHGRLGGHGGLPAVAARAAGPHQPPGARADDRVLAQPPARPGARRRRVHLARRLRPGRPPARARQVLRPADRHDHPPRDGDVPQQRGLHQAAPEREPGPRAARAAHRGPRQLHRGRRQELGAHPDRLPGRHVAHLQRLVLRERPLDRPGAGHGLQPRQRRARRPRRHHRVPPLPRETPADRAADRPQAGGQVRPRRPAAGPGRPARPDLPPARHRDRAGAALARAVARSSRRRSAPRCATPARTSSPPTARSA